MSEFRFDSAVVVLGMHRSGTSALTGVLRLCGLAVPATLIPSSEANERGFWESEVFNLTNDAIFEQMGLTWRSLEAIDASSLTRAARAKVEQHVSEALCGEYAKGVVPLIKDPRICRLLPFWEPALAKLAARTVYPFIVRNPLEIAHSLERRNDLDFDHALLLWARYHLDAEQATRGKPRAFVAYSTLLDDWRGVVALLHSQLALPFALAAIDDAAIGEFLSGDLRHKMIPDQAVAVQSDNLPILADAFRIFSAWSGGQAESDADYRILDEARAQLDRIGPLFSGVAERVRAERKRRSAARTQANEAAAELARANQLVENLGSLSAQLAAVAEDVRRGEAVREFVASQDERFGDFGRRVKKLFAEADVRAQAASADQQAAFAAVEQAIASVAAEAREAAAISAASTDELLNRQAGNFSAVEQRLQSLQSGVEGRAGLDAALVDALEQATLLRRRVAIVEQEGEEARALARLRLGTIQVRDDELAALNLKHAAVADELKTVKRKYRSTQEILARERERLKEVRANLAHADATVAHYRQSFPWQFYMRLTALLGRLRRLGDLVIGNRAAKRHERMVALVDQSSLFDRDWYLEAYPDVAASGIDPVRHYLENGWREGRDPGPGFSTTAYLKAHADVAAHGFNPLLHYVEYGHSEGRGAPETAAPSAKAIAPPRDFGPAAPCATFPVAPERSVAWQRAGRFAPTPALLYTLPHGLVVGKLADEAHAAALQGAIGQLVALSGARDIATSPLPVDGPTEVAVLVDAWYAGRNRLRSRWRGAGSRSPIVVRALQHVGGATEMVGEALVGDILDVVDAKLVNQYFPLLFVFTDPDGLVLGWRHLAFPSLCRRGLHQDEFATLAGDESADVCAVGAEMANRLLAIHAARDLALVGELKIDLAAADGTHPLFQPNFQQWLALVAGVNVGPLKMRGDSGPEHYLADAVQVACSDSRPGAAGSMILGSDMVPSLAAITARSVAGEGDARDMIVSMIVSGDGASRPSLLAQLETARTGELHDGFASVFPTLSLRPDAALGDPVSAFALRAAAPRPLSDAELLVPVSPPALDVAAAETPMTWLLWPGAWREPDLLQSLESLAIQSDAGRPSVLFVGSASDPVTALAGRLFDGRVGAVAAVDQVLDAIRTPLVGYVGASVVLHDRRAAGLMSHLLDDKRNLSASVALVSIERRGKGYLVTPADAGAATTSHGSRPMSAEQVAASAAMLWRSAWPSSAPPYDLWLTRTEQLAQWIHPASAEEREGAHACSTLVTASYCGQRGIGAAAIPPPAAAPDLSLQIEVIV
jgi:hypothetical protein